jgi:hypothetical protein
VEWEHYFASVTDYKHNSWKGFVRLRVGDGVWIFRHKSRIRRKRETVAAAFNGAVST